MPSAGRAAAAILQGRVEIELREPQCGRQSEDQPLFLCGFDRDRDDRYRNGELHASSRGEYNSEM